MSVLNSLPASLNFGGKIFNAGFFLGYLCNINHYAHPTDDRLNGTILITADTSTVPSGVSFTEGVIQNITDIVDLHARTLWLGNARLHISKGTPLYDFMYENDMLHNPASRSHITDYAYKIVVYCTKLIEALITEWGFEVHKEADSRKALVYPPIVDTFNIHGEETALRKFCDIEKRVLAESVSLPEIEFNEDEFIRGLIEGFCS